MRVFISYSLLYPHQLQHVLDRSLIADSLLRTEVYSFRKGSLIVFFRMYAAKSTLDGQLDLHSRAVINLGTIESFNIDDTVILERLRDIVRSAFRSSKVYLASAHGDITIDIDSIKIGHLDQMTEHYFRLERGGPVEKESAQPSDASGTFNVNSHKWASFITDTANRSTQEDEPQWNSVEQHSAPADRLQPTSGKPATSTTMPRTTTLPPTTMKR